jgi:hypothetical protein
VLVFFLLACLAAAFNERALAGPLRERLGGRVEHDEFLPPVSKGLRTGERFLEESNSAQADVWVQIPDWYAGRFVSYAVTRYKSYSPRRLKTSADTPREIKYRTELRVGDQRDREGHIWNYCPAVYQHPDAEGDTFINHETMLLGVYRKIETDRIEYELHSMVTEYGKADHIIRRTFQDEAVQVVTPVENGLQIASWAYFYTEHGEPTGSSYDVSIYHRVEPFRTYDSQDGKDLRASLKKYLLDHGLKRLVPGDLQAARN